MADQEKPQPSGTPQVSFSERLSQALKEQASRRSFSVRLRVRGGLPPKKYAFDFTATGEGAATLQLDDQLKKRVAAGGQARTSLTDAEFLNLLRRVRPALERPTEQPTFLPDTLVGILEISDGTTVRRIYFAADPEQARTQGKVPPREVRQAVDAMYAAGALLAGVKDMKP